MIATNDSTGCPGYTFFVDVTVHPTPKGVNSQDLQCSGEAVDYNLAENVRTLGNGIPASFLWVGNDNPDITGETLTPVFDSIITDVLFNGSGG